MYHGIGIGIVALVSVSAVRALWTLYVNLCRRNGCTRADLISTYSGSSIVNLNFSALGF